MELEAAILPPAIRLNKNTRRYAFRALKLAPNHPVNQQITKAQERSEERSLAIALEEIPFGKARDKAQLSRDKCYSNTQLERIASSIEGIADLSALKPIQHFKWPPWKRSTPYTVNISKQPKEEAAKEHNSLIKLRQADHYIAIYTDASVIERGRGVGVGYCSYYSSLCPIALGYSKHSQNTTNLGQDQLVYNGELEGVTIAAEYTSRVAYPGLHINIFSDNQAGL
jgi:hypothetical protein